MADRFARTPPERPVTAAAKALQAPAKAPRPPREGRFAATRERRHREQAVTAWLRSLSR